MQEEKLPLLGVAGSVSSVHSKNNDKGSNNNDKDNNNKDKDNNNNDNDNNNNDKDNNNNDKDKNNNDKDNNNTDKDKNNNDKDNNNNDKDSKNRLQSLWLLLRPLEHPPCLVCRRNVSRAPDSESPSPPTAVICFEQKAKSENIAKKLETKSKAAPPTTSMLTLQPKQFFH